MDHHRKHDREPSSARAGGTGLRILAALWIVLLLTACTPGELPRADQLPQSIQELPGVSEAMDELPAMLEGLQLDELGLPDLSQIGGLPGIETLPALQAPAGGILFNGPTEYAVAVGERIPGTDIRLLNLTETGAEFEIAGMRSVRVVGDSLDYDGAWPGINGVTYNLRTRIYRVGSARVRAAGVHQMTIEGIAPQPQAVDLGEETLRFPYGSSANVGETFKGMTLGYAGSTERGGEITGLPAGDYPYRKVGDSIKWQGLLRSDIAVEYAARMVLYGESSATIGGVVTVSLPAD